MIEALSVIAVIVAGVATLTNVIIACKRCLLLRNRNRTNNESLDAYEIPQELQNETKEKLQNIHEFDKQLEKIINEMRTSNELFDKLNKQSDELYLEVKSDTIKMFIWEVYNTKKQSEEELKQITMMINELTVMLQDDQHNMKFKILEKLCNLRRALSITEFVGKEITNFSQNNKTQE